MLASDALWDRIAGCLHGLLIGDALGCPVEGWAPEEIRTEFGRLEGMVEIKGRHWRPLGLHSDDGQQSLAVLDAICRDPKHPERPFAELIVALRDAAPQRAGRFGLHRGVGRNFRHTVRGLQVGMRDVYAHATPSAGNGAAMRIAPVALWYRDDSAVRNQRVVQISAVTHSDLRALTGALAVAEAVDNMLVERPPPVLTQRFADAVERAEAQAADQLELRPDTRFSEALRALVNERRRVFALEDVLAGISERAQALANPSHEVAATSGFAPCSVLTALALVDVCGSFEDTLITAVNLGGDTDTIASMAGAIAGAKYGLEQIPQRWLDDLRATGVLLERIEQIVDRAPGRCRPDLLALEKQWDALYELRPKQVL